MTGEEMERAIEFLLQNQAKFDTRLEQIAERAAETKRQLQLYAKTQSEFIQIATTTIQALSEAQVRMGERLTQMEERFNERIVQLDEKFSERIVQLDEKFSERIVQLDKRLNKLSD